MKGFSEGLGNFPTSKIQRIFGKGYSFPMLAEKLIRLQNKERTGKEWKRNKKSRTLHETVVYKIGGTIYEISTSCGGCELLYDKMERLIKAESGKAPTDKKSEVRYNEDSNLFVGRSLQEE